MTKMNLNISKLRIWVKKYGLSQASFLIHKMIIFNSNYGSWVIVYNLDF